MIDLPPSKLDRKFRADQSVRLLRASGVPERAAGTVMTLVKYEDQWRVSRELVYCREDHEPEYAMSAFFEDELEAV